MAKPKLSRKTTENRTAKADLLAETSAGGASSADKTLTEKLTASDHLRVFWEA